MWQQQQEMAQARKRSDFFVPRSEKILESNIQYRLSQEVVPLFLQKKVYVLNKYYLHFTEKYLSRRFFR
jgi:hypothetical protein